jgi:hypothetical protein
MTEQFFLCVSSVVVVVVVVVVVDPRSKNSVTVPFCNLIDSS